MVVSPTSQDRAPERLEGVCSVPFDTVVDEHGGAVLRVCRALVGPDDAADAWSETFLSALRSYPDLDPAADVRAWLLTIARRRSIDQLRARGRSPVPVGAAPLDVPAPSSADPLPMGTALLDAVRSLPPRQREVVTYRYLADLSYDEISTLVDSNPAAVRRSAADGIAALRAARRSWEEP